MSSKIVTEYVSFTFFFFKQKTAYEIVVSDWSSDVCSSDLEGKGRVRGKREDINEKI